jgi:tetratricopeptide (TPR) repeat protein
VAACGEPATCREAIPLLARAYRATRRFEDAVETFGAIVGSVPAVRADALAARAGFLDRLSELADAERDYAEAAALDPGAETYESLGTLRLRMERPEAALDAYGHALALAPSDPQTRYLHARALWLTGHDADAERELDVLLADQPGFGAAWAVKGRLRERAGDEAGAVAAFRSAIEGDPENVEARFMLARRALAAHDVAAAEARLAEIQEIDRRGGAGRRGAGEVQR